MNQENQKSSKAAVASHSDKHIHLIRLHNLPRNSSLTMILRFLWEAGTFECEDAMVLAYSAKNCIVGFTQKEFADDAVIYSNGRVLFGRIVGVCEATEEDLLRVREESREAGPELGPLRLNKGIPGEPEKLNANEEDIDYEDDSFQGLYACSDSEPDEMDLPIPEFFMRGKPPDTIDFMHNSPTDSTGTSTNNGGQLTASSTTRSSTEMVNNMLSPNGDDELEILGVNQPSKPSLPLKRKLTPSSSISSRSPNAAGSLDIAYRSPLQQMAHNQQQQQQSSSTAPVGMPPGKRPRLDPRMSHPRSAGPAATGANAVPCGPWRFPVPEPASIAVTQMQNRPLFPRPPRMVTPGMPGAPQPQRPPMHVRPPPPINRRPSISNNIQLVVSSTHALIKWILPEDPYIDSQQVEITGPGLNAPVVRPYGREQKHLQEVLPGYTYEVTIRGYDVMGAQIAHSGTQFRANYSQHEMRRLYELANDFCAIEMYLFEILHRCKPTAYWDAIYNQPDGRRMMMPYLKDENGHPASPINGTLNGFFFSSLLHTDSLPDSSPFGDVQMIMDANKMLDFHRMNMYFADFYCNEAFCGVQGVSSYLHYITVVVCKRGSEADRFCADRLIPLDPKENRFIKILPQRDGNIKYLTNNRQGLLVEIYYTEPISLFEAKKFREVKTIGRGSSRPGGLPNNKLCTVCNFT